ncbi:MAG: SMP-30/gluconolactonase/LRE family protein [Bryobacteraceae bacterium]|nr:SMP-30/gluconolactonase/LRE family protein [Bryobacteraceae bacterium]
MKSWQVLALAALAGLLTWVVLPAPIDAVAYQPPAAPPLTGPFEPNDRLARTEFLAKGAANGPEDVIPGEGGVLWTGMADGAIRRMGIDGRLETIAHTGGRPLGLRFHPDGRLIIADARKGLLAMSAGGQLETLLTEAGGVKLGFTDDLDVSSAGVVYFSDASSKFGYGREMLDVLEGAGHGRLIAYDPRSRQAKVLLSGLGFANGVALSADESFVLVNETSKTRIRRYWLKGPKAGSDDVFFDNLPGFPDGISSNRQGRFWVAIFAPRNAELDRMHPHPFWKRIVSKLPPGFLPRPAAYGMVLALDEFGRIQANLQDPSGRVSPITNVEEHQGVLLLGNLTQDWIGRLTLPRL